MKVLVLGYFGYRTNKLDGQTVKTRNIFSLLNQRIKDVDYFDTEEFKFSKKSIFTLLKKLIQCKSLIYLPAHGNLKYIFPILFILAQIIRFRINYFIIGGWLVEYLEHKPVHRIMLKRIHNIFSETLLMKEQLYQKYSFENVSVFPNFRLTTFKPQISNSIPPLKLVFMARINKMKGIDTIFTLADHLKNNYNSHQIIIDFYGQINPNDKIFFESGLKQFNFINYKGSLQPNEIYSVLSQYDVMLLPTHYYTEGLPGSIIDAYISGIPVIATKWKHAHEFITDKETGFIIPFENGENKLIQIINFLYNNPTTLLTLKKNASIESNKYKAENAWEIITRLVLN